MYLLQIGASMTELQLLLNHYNFSMLHYARFLQIRSIHTSTQTHTTKQTNNTHMHARKHTHTDVHT